MPAVTPCAGGPPAPVRGGRPLLERVTAIHRIVPVTPASPACQREQEPRNLYHAVCAGPPDAPVEGGCGGGQGRTLRPVATFRAPSALAGTASPPRLHQVMDLRRFTDPLPAKRAAHAGSPPRGGAPFVLSTNCTETTDPHGHVWLLSGPRLEATKWTTLTLHGVVRRRGVRGGAGPMAPMPSQWLQCHAR
jgi:hypothetical protein